MSDRMDKDAMDKFFNYMKSAYPYPPSSYSMRNPYYQTPQDYPKQDKEKKTPADSFQQMYGYPPYNPYQMPPMGYPQHYGAPEHENQSKNDEDNVKNDVPNPYGPYYPYHYGYPYPYGYPPYYFGRDSYPSKSAPSQSFTSHAVSYPPGAPSMDAPQLKILSKSQDKPVKQEIVISSDSQDVLQEPAVVPKPMIQVPMLEEKPVDDKKSGAVDSVNVEENELDPFFIRKKHKILKQEKELPTKTRITRTLKQLAVVEKEKQFINRHSGMTSQTYQEMMKKQTRMRLELFYQRERLRRQQEKAKQTKEKEAKEKEKQIKIDKSDKSEKADTEKKPISDDKSDKDKKEVKPPVQANKNFPVIAPLIAEEKKEEAKQRERIKDDHPLKELRYNQSHGRIRLGGHFQSSIPTLMRHQDLAARRVQLQKRLKEREVSAITF